VFKKLLLILILVNLLAVPGWARTQSIGKDQVNVRSQPSLKGHVVFRAPIGYPVEIKRRKGKWVLIQDWEGDAGWVFMPLLSNFQTAVVLVDNANVRCSPGIRHGVTTQVHRGEIYKVLERKGEWIKVGYYFEGNEIGWIRQDLIFGD
jgi:uncharacterized protein YgiM (DUF1202 family)